MTDPRYTAIMFCAVAVCALLLRLGRESVALTAGERMAVGLGAFCGAMIGAKLPFAMSDWNGLVDGTVWFSNGKTILAGLVGGYFGVEFVKWSFQIRTKTGDWFVVPVAVAVGIGRIGCFVAGCCYGLPTSMPWGVKFPIADSTGAILARHPTQLYEAFFHFAIAGLISWLRYQGIWRGNLVKFYLLCYLVFRFFTEWLRPEHRYFGGLTMYQWSAIGLIPVFALLWIRDARRSSKGCSIN